MQTIAVIGYGAVASYVRMAATSSRFRVAAVIGRPGRENAARAVFGEVPFLAEVSRLPVGLDVVVDCAGHAGLRDHGAGVLRRGLPLVTVSIGALADDGLRAELAEAARAGGSRLHLASGAIGALDALSAASAGRLEEVRYTGRKPPSGWAGSPAEKRLDLRNLSEPAVHFDGSARDCALTYPKNANVAASVALAGLGFDRTGARLIADPTTTRNTHEISARGDFGELNFTIAGKGMPDNPKSSALTAMSVVRTILNREERIVFG
ncbi:aspartate dehydrogenase [Sedimentitalea sp. JM2-8]|uniref:L-aspartate dehydrogenase n=1 Tax=Sedimentitalea xiamensis TaxID=3050037 RepID=A0ABT7FD27_9RHOB|nr:aspartate dehydrogenase [Sedimentitalea xiamensis]MDK3073018.1 aspartate dehydrogenase [Sedimentitalea xiamensis]